MAKLTEEAIRQALTGLPGWELTKEGIRKKYEFPGFPEAVRFGFGKSPAFIREGGSIGAVVTMHRHLKAPIVCIGLSLPEHGYHAPNENYDWGQASGGMVAFAKYFESVGGLARAKD